ncbi:MAG: P-loop NTPase fold protein [Verrucomicrobiales bacterium]|nr:P-loop NTPase fold protein [Verrucomicrobiales bacterium]
MWSDNETTNDLFGFRVHADLMRELILDPKILPVTIGVFGDWGGGKSSIMQMLKEDLSPEGRAQKGGAEDLEGVVVLYFNGWLFEGYDDAKAALLTSILTSLRENKTFGNKIKKSASRLLKQVNMMRGAKMLLSGALVGGVAAATGGVGLAAILPAVAAGMAASAQEKLPEAVEKSLEGEQKEVVEEAVSDIRQFREDFAKLLEEAGIRTLVVLIDDLDRCSPERIIENLEAIKLFLNVQNTAFVIGADRRIISQAVSWRYRETLAAAQRSGEGADRLVEDYLEKLIQIPYRLPKLSPSEIESYLSLLFCQRHLSDELYEAVCGEAQQLREKERYRAFDQVCVLEALDGEEITKELRESLRIGSRIAGQMTDVLQGNPRQVKRFLNAFFLRRRLADVAKLNEINDEALVKLMLLEYSAPKLFENLFSEMDGESGTVARLVAMEGIVEGDEESPDGEVELEGEWKQMTKWLSMEPKLSGVDLRDYLWVTRDRLGSTMSGTTLVPTVVREVLKKLLSNLSDRQGINEAERLNSQEFSILIEQLGVIARRDPSSEKPFKALIGLGENRDEAAEVFGAVIKGIPGGDLSPALAVQIETIAKSRGRLGEVCKGIVSDQRGENTRFAKGFSVNKRKK